MVENVEADTAELEIDTKDILDRKKWRRNVIRGKLFQKRIRYNLRETVKLEHGRHIK